MGKQVKDSVITENVSKEIQNVREHNTQTLSGGRELKRRGPSRAPAPPAQRERSLFCISRLASRGPRASASPGRVPWWPQRGLLNQATAASATPARHGAVPLRCAPATRCTHVSTRAAYSAPTDPAPCICSHASMYCRHGISLRLGIRKAFSSRVHSDVPVQILPGLLND